MYVIVQKGTKVKRTWVNSRSISKSNYSGEKTYAEAILNQCPELETKMVEFCRLCAKCNVSCDLREFMSLVYQRMVQEIQAYQQKGSTTVYRSIIWKNEKKRAKDVEDKSGMN